MPGHKEAIMSISTFPVPYLVAILQKRSKLMIPFIPPIQWPVYFSPDSVKSAIAIKTFWKPRKFFKIWDADLIQQHEAFARKKRDEEYLYNLRAEAYQQKQRIAEIKRLTLYLPKPSEWRRLYKLAKHYSGSNKTAFSVVRECVNGYSTFSYQMFHHLEHQIMAKLVPPTPAWEQERESYDLLRDAGLAFKDFYEPDKPRERTYGVVYMLKQVKPPTH